MADRGEKLPESSFAGADDCLPRVHRCAGHTAADLAPDDVIE
ncbi:hypothetical protein ACF073_23805 [Streptomyces sp. NPDC015171]